MAQVSAIGGGACEGLVDALRAEFGMVLAARIIESEALDFLWDARVSERYLGQHFGPENNGEMEHCRVAIMSFFDGIWHAAVCVVDGDGDAVALLWERRCDGRDEARAAYERAV